MLGGLARVAAGEKLHRGLASKQCGKTCRGFFFSRWSIEYGRALFAECARASGLYHIEQGPGRFRFVSDPGNMGSLRSLSSSRVLGPHPA